MALEEGLAQRKTVERMPPLAARDLAAHVALLPRRYFLMNGVTLVTDAVPLGRGARNGHRAVLLAAASEPLVTAVAEGVRAAGLMLEAIAPAAEFAANGDVAFAAAAGARSRLSLLPGAARAAADRARRTGARRWLVAGLASLVLAGCTYLFALAHERRAAEAELARLAPAVRHALAARRDLGATTDALGFLARADRGRPRRAALLASLTRALPDSAFVVSIRLGADGRGTLSGYARRAGAVVAALERVNGLRGAALEGPVTREVVGGKEWDRFTIRFTVVPEDQR